VSAPSSSPAGGDAGLVPSAPGVTALVGEVHLHQFPGGTHAWTAIVDRDIPPAFASKDSITEIDTVVSSQEGPCTLYTSPTCTPDCAGATYCFAPDSCQPLPEWPYIDGGEVDVTGSSVVPRIRMWWDTAAATYVSDPAPGGPELFAGGETLHLAGGTGDHAFTFDVPAPKPIALSTPDPMSDLHLVPGALEVAWTSGIADSVEVIVVAQASTGAQGEIRCVTTDSGSLTIPADLMNAIPPPPRQTSFQILRNNERIAPVARAGAGLFIHAGQTTWIQGVD